MRAQPREERRLEGPPGPQGLAKVHTWAHAEQCWEKQRSPRTKSGDITHTGRLLACRALPLGRLGSPSWVPSTGEGGPQRPGKSTSCLRPREGTLQGGGEGMQVCGHHENGGALMGGAARKPPYTHAPYSVLWRNLVGEKAQSRVWSHI